MKKARLTRNNTKEKILLVVLNLKHKQWPVTEILHEMEALVAATGGVVEDSVICRVDKFSARNLIGEGKLQDIALVCQEKELDTVIFSHDLKGTQQRNVEDVLQLKTIDRTQLILDIFAKRAKSREGRMQVELAQLEYLLPRLVGKGIELSRLGGGIGTLGPGETKLEVDRRRIFQRIASLKRELKAIAHNRMLTRKKRKDKGIPAISLVGYTNAGKSTLLNLLTRGGQEMKDGLFTTLDPLSRQLILANHQKIILSDTVGFMRDLPHHLIESFKATLEEVKEADVLLHVLDISHPQHRSLDDSVMEVLHGLGASDKPMIYVLNKIDKIQDEKNLQKFQKDYENAVCVSAAQEKNIDQLRDRIKEMLSFLFVEVDVHIPIKCMNLVNLAHAEGEVFSVKYYADTINLRASVPSSVAGKLYKVQVPSVNE
jgi:GTP-binding protein HflX